MACWSQPQRAVDVRLLDAATRAVVAEGVPTFNNGDSPAVNEDSVIADLVVPEAGTYLVQLYARNVFSNATFDCSVVIDIVEP